MTRITVVFKHLSSTKHCERYQASEEDAKAAKLRSQAIYFERERFGNSSPPREVALTFQWD